MVENLDNDKKNTESKNSLKKEFEGKILSEIEKINSIIQRMPKDEAIKEIMKLKDDKTNAKFLPVYNDALSYLNGDIEKGGKDGFDARTKKFADEENKNLDSILQSVFEAGMDIQTKDEIVKEVKEKFGKGTSIEDIQKYVDGAVKNFQFDINENETSNYEANIGEEESEDGIEFFDPSRPKTDDIKKMYKYKVEGKITSGISELDQFLEIIQPALNQLIIIPWKLRYELIDARNDMLEKWKVWQDEVKNLRNDFETLKVMDPEMMNGVELSSRYNVKKMQKEVLSYFNKYQTRQLNNQLDEDKETDILVMMNGAQQAGQPITREEAEKLLDNDKYTKRKKIIDYSKEAKTSRKVLAQECQKLIKNHCRGSDGKITDDGKNYLKGYAHMIDLFNLEGKDKIHQFTDATEFIMDESNGRSKAGAKAIEDEDVISMLDEEEAERKQAKLIAENMVKLNKDNEK
ncbi:MAG: hypothetical protein K6F04_01985 [bacterium]|nr:hypothetical protein [bacterium]